MRNCNPLLLQLRDSPTLAEKSECCSEAHNSKQAEPRVLAHMSGDPFLIKPYIKGGDLYIEAAMKVYAKKYNMTYEQFLESDDTTWREKGMAMHPRQLFKRGLLSTMYNTSAFGLSTMLGITVEEGQQFIDDFYAEFAVAKSYGDECVAFVDKHGYCTTLGGRKRRFPGHVNTASAYHRLMREAERHAGKKLDNIWTAKIPYSLKQQLGPVSRDYNKVIRQIVNARTQGTAAEIMKDALIAVDELFEKGGRVNQIVGTVHDSMVLLVKDDATAEEFEEIRKKMESAARLDLPFKVDIGISMRYGNDVPINDWLEKGYDCFDERGFAV